MQGLPDPPSAGQAPAPGFGDRAAAPRRRSLRRQLITSPLLAIGLSVLLLGSVRFLLSVLDAAERREADLAESAEAISRLVAAYVQENQRGIFELSVLTEEIGGASERARLERRLRELHHRYPEILTFIITDSEGRVIVSEQHLSRGGGPFPGEIPPVNDREYFRQPRATGRLYMSDAFVGRGFGQDPIVALSAPWRHPDGSFGGIVEGSLDLDRLEELGAIFERLEALEMAIVDGHAQLLWSRPARDGSHLPRVLVDETGFRLPGDEARSLIVARRDVPGTTWSVVVQQPMAEIYRGALDQGWITLSWMAVVFLAAALFAHSLSRRITRPLEEVTASLDRIELDAAPPAPIPLRDDAPHEVATIIHATGRLRERLRTSYERISQLLAEREATIEGEIRQRARAERQRDQLFEDFVSIVSHELRTPLTSIRGSLALILAGVAGAAPERVRALVEIGARNSERLIRLVNDILDVQKIESGALSIRPARVDLHSVLEQAAENNRSYAQGHDVELHVEPGEERILVWADADRLQQVLANLLSNAAKFSPRGGLVTVSARSVDGRARVSVSDRGPGIPVAFQPRVFEKFAQADTSAGRQKGGTGLGLSIARSIVERHGGKIWFETAPGAGTTFTFEIPEWSPEAESILSARPPAA